MHQQPPHQLRIRRQQQLILDHLKQRIQMVGVDIGLLNLLSLANDDMTMERLTFHDNLENHDYRKKTRY